MKGTYPELMGTHPGRVCPLRQQKKEAEIYPTPPCVVDLTYNFIYTTGVRECQAFFN